MTTQNHWKRGFQGLPKVYFTHPFHSLLTGDCTGLCGLLNASCSSVAEWISCSHRQPLCIRWLPLSRPIGQRGDFRGTYVERQIWGKRYVKKGRKRQKATLKSGRRDRNVSRVVEVRRRDCWVTLPCRCDRGSSAYQIDGDCLAMGGGGREGGGEGEREEGVWQKSVCLSTPPDTCLPVWDDMGDNIDNIKRNNCVSSSSPSPQPLQDKINVPFNVIYSWK